MENRFLFRAKRIDNSEWVEGMPFEIEGKTMMQWDVVRHDRGCERRWSEMSWICKDCRKYKRNKSNFLTNNKNIDKVVSILSGE